VCVCVVSYLASQAQPRPLPRREYQGPQAETQTPVMIAAVAEEDPAEPRRPPLPHRPLLQAVALSWVGVGVALTRAHLLPQPQREQMLLTDAVEEGGLQWVGNQAVILPRLLPMPKQALP
jgi:hypothetical protein